MSPESYFTYLCHDNITLHMLLPLQSTAVHFFHIIKCPLLTCTFRVHCKNIKLKTSLRTLLNYEMWKQNHQVCWSQEQSWPWVISVYVNHWGACVIRHLSKRSCQAEIKVVLMFPSSVCTTTYVSCLPHPSPHHVPNVTHGHSQKTSGR